MRLFEYDTGTVPDLRQFITPDLVQDIIDIEKWVHHGSDLEEWLDISMFASDNADRIGITAEEAAELEQMPYEEHLHHPNFKKCIAHWIESAISQTEDALRQGCPYDKIPPFGPEMPLYRCMMVTSEWLANPSPNFGKFWSAASGQARRFVAKRAGPDSFNVAMCVKAGHLNIDWEQTLRSRLDYGHGLDEHEFQLSPGAVVSNVHIKVLETGQTMTKTGKA